MGRMVRGDFDDEPLLKVGIQIPASMAKKLQHEAVENNRFLSPVVIERLLHSYQTPLAIKPLSGTGRRAKIKV